MITHIKRTGQVARTRINPTETQIIEKTPPLLLTVTDSIDFTGMSRNRIYDLVKEGRLKPVKLGKRTMFARKHLEEFVQTLIDEANGNTIDAP